VLSRQDLADLQRKLATMSITGLQDFYRAAYYRCRLENRAHCVRAAAHLAALRGRDKAWYRNPIARRVATAALAAWTMKSRHDRTVARMKDQGVASSFCP
jgi:hypothetical protein